jgi:diguanylate cyclase (GGDEF)-like protein
MSTRSPQNHLVEQAPAPVRPYVSHRPQPSKAIFIQPRKNSPENELEETLSSALLAADSELGQIVREVDEISKALRGRSPDAQSVRVASHPAVWSAVKQALLDRELRYLALTDDLTCLYNRRGFFAAATQQLRFARRNGQSMLLLFCDLDRFKNINDRHGHREGDHALVRMADVLAEVFRDSDILARLGGDEFAILALENASQSQDVILRRLENRVKKANASEPRYELSLSVGVARYDPRLGISLGDLLAQADKAMYEKKRSKLQDIPSRT